jgi:hypothetical protein
MNSRGTAPTDRIGAGFVGRTLADQPHRLVMTVIFGLSAACTVAYGQRVAGTAHIGDGRTPSAETSILLVDSAGRIASGTITSASGRYSLGAERPGVFRIRARRIGFSPDSSSVLHLEDGQTVTFDPKMERLTANLDAVSVEGSQRCSIRPAEGDLAYKLWEAAQNSLASTVASSLSNENGFVLEHFQRELDPATRRILTEKVWETRTSSNEPYLSFPAESLAAYGFVRSGSDSSTYFAPDARTLTSDAFSNGHCFRPLRDPKNPDRIGLTFEPVSKSKGVDVAGTLWLERATSEVRSLEYRYLSGADEDTSVANGHIDYSRIQNGRSIVTDWVIRVPVRKRELRAVPASSGDIASRPVLRQMLTTRVVALWEFGGRVKAVVDPAEVSSVGSSASVVQGTVLRQQGQTALAGIRVALTAVSDSSKMQSATTGNDGSFRFEAVEEGDYLLTVPEPRLDTLNTPVQPIGVHVSSASEQTVTITVAEPGAGRAALCQRDLSTKSIVLHGVVRDSASGQPIPSATVNARWLSDVLVSGGLRNISAAPHSLTTVTDDAGRYVFCGLEPTSRLLLSSASGSAQSRAYPSLTVRPGQTLRFDLAIHDRGASR